jgi:hypothetical protein
MATQIAPPVTKGSFSRFTGWKLCWLSICLLIAGLGALKAFPASRASAAGSYASPFLLTGPDGSVNGLHGGTTGLSSKAIEKLKVGDYVLAYDFETNKLVPRKILELHRGTTSYWVHVYLANGTKVVATKRHPFWVESECDWIDAQDLYGGMTIRLYDGQILEITKVDLEELDRPQDTFNLTVETDHNYFAGASSVLVHNGPGPGYFQATDFIVYRWQDAAGNWYIGRTRMGSANAPWNYRYSSQPNNFQVLEQGLTYEQCRGLEQHYMDTNPNKSALNQRAGIDPNRYAQQNDSGARARGYQDAAKDYLKNKANGPTCN